MTSKQSKRETLIYTVVSLWITMGIFATYHETPLTDLAVYFTALTGFIAAYIFGESKNRSANSIFKGQSSKRQLMIYVSVGLWAILGVFGILNTIPLKEASAYFASLTPFVGAYILGSTFRPTNEKEKD